MPIWNPPPVLTHEIGGNTAGATADIYSGTYLLAGGNNITLSQNSNSVTISAGAGAGGAGSNTLGMSNLGNTSGTTGVVTGTAIQYVFAGGNNVTLSQSLNAASVSGTITISAFNQSAQSLQTQMTGLTAGMSTQGNTSGTTGLVSNQLIIVGGNNITLSQSVNAQSATLTISGPNTVAQSVQTQMTGLSAGMSTGGNTLGDTGVKSNRLVLAGGNNITLSGSTNAESMTITISAANSGTAPPIATDVKVVQSSGSTGTITRFAPEDHAHQGQAGWDVNGIASTFFGTQQLSAGAMISIATGGGTSRGSAQVIDLWSSATTVSSVATANALGAMASRAALEGHQHGGVPTVSVVGNTAGNTTQGNLSLILAGGPNITLSGGTAAGAMTLSVSAAVAAAAAQTISKWPSDDDPGWSGFAPTHTGASGSTGGSTQWTVSGNVWSVPFPYQLEFSQINMGIAAQATSSNTGSATIGQLLGIYTLNANTVLSLVSSFVWTLAMSQNSITAQSYRWGWGTNSTSNSSSLGGNVSASFSTNRAISIYGSAATLSASNYYMAHMMTQRSSSVNVYGVGSIEYINPGGGFGTTTIGSFIGQSSLTAPTGFMGIFSTTSNGSAISNLVMPGSINTSAITGSASSQWRLLYLNIYRSTT